MPLETLRKPVQEFSGDGWYPTTGDDTKRTSEAVIESRDYEYKSVGSKRFCVHCRKEITDWLNVHECFLKNN